MDTVSRIERLRLEWAAIARFGSAMLKAGGFAPLELAHERAEATARADLAVRTVEATEAEWREGLADLIAQVPAAADLEAATKTGTPPRQVWGYVGALLQAAQLELDRSTELGDQARAALTALSERYVAIEAEATALRSLVGPTRAEARTDKQQARYTRELARVAAALAQRCSKCSAAAGSPCRDLSGGPAPLQLERPRRAPHPERFEGLSSHPSEEHDRSAEQPAADAAITKEK